MDYILQIEGVSKSFSKDIVGLGGRREREKFYLLNNLHLKVQRETITAILGGNGAGKTTLFNLICNMITPDAGRILYHTLNETYTLNQVPSYRIAQIGIGRLFQRANIFKEMTVLENMLVANGSRHNEMPFCTLFRTKPVHQVEQQWADRAYQIWDELLGLDNVFYAKQHQLAGSLSYGQQRLLGFARLLMADHQLILLDEPTSGVNETICEKIKHIIRRLDQEGRTILLIEHNLDFVKDIAEYSYYLAEGQVLRHGTPQNILETRS